MLMRAGWKVGEESKGKCEINHGMQLLLTELDIFREGNVSERDVV
jgi:hypothetical protein